MSTVRPELDMTGDTWLALKPSVPHLLLPLPFTTTSSYTYYDVSSQCLPLLHAPLPAGIEESRAPSCQIMCFADLSRGERKKRHRGAVKAQVPSHPVPILVIFGKQVIP